VCADELLCSSFSLPSSITSSQALLIPPLISCATDNSSVPPPPPPHHHHHHCHLHHTLQIINWSCGYFIALLLAAIDSITSSSSSHPTASIAHALLSSHLPSFALHFCDSSFSSSSATLDYELAACILVAQVYSVEKITRVSSSILASSSVLHIMRHTSHVTRHTPAASHCKPRPFSPISPCFKRLHGFCCCCC
jgi:hypothetical protein